MQAILDKIGRRKLWAVLANLEILALRAPEMDEAILFDLDTPEDYNPVSMDTGLTHHDIPTRAFS